MTMLSSTRISNMALSHIGSRSSIESLAEESPEAKECALWFDYARKEALEAYDWNFARKRFTLAQHGEVPPTDVWIYRYQYPPDALVVRKLENVNSPPDDASPFVVEVNSTGQEKTILTDVENAIAVYTFDQLDTNMFSPLFVSVLSHLLAHHIAFQLTGKRGITDDQRKRFESIIRSGSASNANEMVGKPPRDTDWIRGRNC